MAYLRSSERDIKFVSVNYCIAGELLYKDVKVTSKAEFNLTQLIHCLTVQSQLQIKTWGILYLLTFIQTVHW